jgi:putative membrane protein
MGLIVKLFTTVLALLLAAEFVPGIAVDGFYTAVIVGLLLGIASITVRPLLVLLTLPITIITLGLFVFVINALILWFIASFVDGFTIDGFVPALITALAISALHWLIDRLGE